MTLSLLIVNTVSVRALVLFQEDDFKEFNSESLLLDTDGAGANNTSIQFGNDIIGSENGNIIWDITNNEFQFDHDLNVTGGIEVSDGITVTGGIIDFSSASSFVPVQSASDPATCTIGQVYFNTTDKLLRACTSENVWSVVRDGGDAQTLDAVDSSQLLRSDVSDNFTSGTFKTSEGTTLDVDGVLDASGATRMALAQAASDPGTCTIGDMYFNTTDKLLRSCTALDTWTLIDTDTTNPDQDFEGVLSTDSDKILTTSNTAFTVNTGTSDFIVTSNDWGVDLSGNISTSGTVDGVDVSAIGAQAHNQNTDTSSTTNNFTLDVDNTGGDVTLQFGATLNEHLKWDNANNYFFISDALVVDGNLNVQDTTIRLDSDNIGVGATVDIVAEQGTDSDGTLRYSSANNRWEISNDGGAFVPVLTSSSSDANTLDTLDSTQFLRSDTTDNYTSGTLTFDNGTTFTANGAVNLGDGGDDIAINSNDWDISTAGVASGFTGITSTGTVDYSGSGALRIRENSNPSANSACANIGELIYDTTNKRLQHCTVTGVAGSAIWRNLNREYVEMFAVVSNSPDDTWTDKNLFTDHGVPKGAVVDIMVELNTNDRFVGIRKNGSVLDRRVSVKDAFASFIVESDVNGVIEVYEDDAGGTEIYIMGYWY